MAIYNLISEELQRSKEYHQIPKLAKFKYVQITPTSVITLKMMACTTTIDCKQSKHAVSIHEKDAKSQSIPHILLCFSADQNVIFSFYTNTIKPINNFLLLLLIHSELGQP